MANGRTNGNGNGKANGNGKSEPYYRSKADCFIAYREGRSLRFIGEHSRFNRKLIARWRDEDKWDEQVKELDSERIRLHQTRIVNFETEFQERLRAILDRKLPEIEARLKSPLDLLRLFKIYHALRELDRAADAGDVADIIQRVDVSLDPEDDDE